MAEWSEIDLDKRIWRIPAARMKMRREHVVPLASQVIELLTVLKQLTGSGRYVFPAVRDSNRPMSDGTVRIALRTMGFDKDLITPHGFRAMFSTIANEYGFNRDVIERQLAHVDKIRSELRITGRNIWLTECILCSGGRTGWMGCRIKNACYICYICYTRGAKRCEY